MIQKIITTVSTGVAAMALLVAPAIAAGPMTLSPWVYDPGNVCDVVSQFQSANSLRLEKNCTTATNAAAGAEITGVNGLGTTGLTLSFDYNGYCGAGAPRFNVYLSNGQTIFLGCTYGGGGATSGTATFTAGNTYGGVLFPTGQTVTGIDIVQDEEGQVTISNVQVNGQTITGSSSALKDACKKDGYKDLTDANGDSFRNQGQCVSYFNHI